MNDKIKNIFIDIVVVFLIPIGIFALYQTFVVNSGGGSGQSGSVLVGEGQKFLVKLNDLNALKLDTSIFESALYQSLVDTSVPPPTEATGRPHPFLPPVTPTAPSVSATQTSSLKTKSANVLKNLNTLVGQ